MRTFWLRSTLLVVVLALSVAAGGCKDDNTSKGTNKGEPKAKTTPKEDDKKDAKAKTGETTKTADKDKTAEDAGGQWVESKLYGVKFRIPEDWKVDIDEQGISANAPDATTTVILVGSDSDALINSAVTDIKKKVVVNDVNVEKAKAIVRDSMPGQAARGTGVIKKKVEDGEIDQEIQFMAYVVQKDKKAVTMMIFSEAEMYEAKKEIIEGISQTLKQM